MVGRPFLVYGVARTAACRARGDWHALSRPDVGSLTAEERRSLGEHWCNIAALEHASIGAFARFALQLLALGAPASLLHATHEALADETRHAQLAFGLASAYLGRALGPAELDCAGALDQLDLPNVARAAFLEGCIGETVAALDAEWALQDCRDPVVAAVLREIAADEAKHAELAWLFAAWVLQQAPHLHQEWLQLAQSELQCALDESETTPPAHDDWRCTYGVNTQGLQLRISTLQQVVLPTLQALWSTTLVRSASRGEVGLRATPGPARKNRVIINS
jgi:hypothetical protein